MIVLVVLGTAAALALLALWPPASAPPWWRDLTRPVRHRLRPRHYGHYR
ncbi:MAG: hypothetical protein ACR2KK_10300 [Acidimicrobiales bacterium]